MAADRSTAGRLKHIKSGLVWACPDCDTAGQLYEREDGSIRCNDCGGTCGLEDVVERESRRGSNLTPELRAKGSRNGPDRDMAEIASHPRKATPGGQPDE